MTAPWTIHHGDVRRVCKTLPADYFDATLSDPPYGLSFMGRRWDYSVPSALLWSEVERTLKPGAHGMMFGGSRTFHRTAVAVEDGGFEIRDVLMWLYGSGFPKNYDIAKGIDSALGETHNRKVVGYKESGLDKTTGVSMSLARKTNTTGRAANGLVPITASATDAAARWDGFGTALKPGYEPILLVRRYSDETIANNALKWGTGGLNLGESRVEGESRFNSPADPTRGFARRVNRNEEYRGAEVEGRWPANVLLTHSPICVEKECVDDCPVRMIDAQSGNRPGMKGGGKHRADYAGGMFGAIDSTHTSRGDDGGASRFFYTVKADPYQRESGTEAIRNANGDGARGNHHPTVKPIELIRYLAKLLLPPKRSTPRRILVPFSGSGSEMIACLQAGWEVVVGIEREASYIEVAKARITKGGVLSGLQDRKLRRKRTK